MDQTMFSMKASRQIHHPIFARVNGRVAAAAEMAGRAEHRAELLAGLSGMVIEVGARSGLYFAHYPRGVTGGAGRGA